MTDMGFDPLRQANDLAIVNELFTPWGQLRSMGVGSYNFGVKIGGGLRSIDDLLRDGVDAAVVVQEETRAAAGIQLDSPFARAIAPQIEGMSPGARLALEVAGDAIFFVPMAAEFRGMTSEISAFNRPLFEFSPSSSGPRQFANQVGAVGDLSSLRAPKLRNTPGVATASGELSPASGNWLDPSVPTPIPGQIAESIVGQQFASFDKLREAIWRAIAADPELSKIFTASNRGNIAAGNAPFAPRPYQVNTSDAGSRFNLHHVESIETGGPVYDLNNLQIVSPKVHAEIHY